MSELIKLFSSIVAVVAIYFFSFQILNIFKGISIRFSSKVGRFTVDKEHAVQRYVFMHRSSLVAKVYTWLNEQLIAIGLKRAGVTAVGYVVFWAFVSALMSVVITVGLGLNVGGMLFLSCAILFCTLIMTRVLVAERMERRESDIMDALDLIIPEVSGGVKNAIIMYTDNFAPSLQQDFKAFVTNIQDRGYSFEDAMYLLADNLGSIFKDFAQKAIFFEALGEKDMADIFTDIVETNRLRRELRYTNSVAFGTLKTSFVVSAGMTFAYFIFIVTTDAFSRHFFIETNLGRMLLVVILLIVFGVLSYITTIKSRTL